MPVLIHLLLRNFASGFLLGCAVALAIVLANPDMPLAGLVTAGPLELWLWMFSFGAPFGLGAIGTALALGTDA